MDKKAIAPVVSITARRVGLGEMLEAIPDGVITVDSAGTIVLCNSYAAKLFGYDEEGLIGQPVDALLPARFRAEHQAHRARFSAAGERRRMGQGIELRAQHHSGHELDVEIEPNPVTLDGQPATIAIVRDVGERVSLVRALRISEGRLKVANTDLENRIAARTAALQTAVEELDAFSYSVAHDLRAPLRQIDGFSRLLAEDLGDALSTGNARHLKFITDGAQRMSQLIGDLLSLAHISQREISSELTDIGVVVGSVVANLEPDCRGRSIEWAIAPLPEVRCDPAQVRILFTNLLANAVKFTRPREHAVIEVGVTDDPEPGTFSVRDNGVGFDMRYADKLFGVFQRLHPDREFPGTGIGLATVRRVVRRHRGTTWASAAPDKGATFFFTLAEAGPAATADGVKR